MKLQMFGIGGAIMTDHHNKKIPLVRLENIYKSFSSNLVLKGVCLEVHTSEVVALIGGNGAGKSTLMKILMGIYTPNSGTIEINGEKMNLNNPSIAHSQGIYLVPQEPMLFPNMTVEENILIGFNTNQAELKEKVEQLIKRLGWSLSLSRLANTLSIAEQQLVEILRGLLREAKVLILDEPTSALTFAEIKSLFQLIKELKSEGVGIFYITHRLSEVFEIATDVAILRDGIVTLKGPVNDFDEARLIQGLLPPQTVTKEIDTREDVKKTVDTDKTQPIMEIKDYSGYGFNSINLNVYPGEILGIAGVVGAGRTELAEAIFGLGDVTGGKILLDNEDITGKQVSEVIKKGLNYIPEDRYLNGVFTLADVKSNMTASVLKWLSKVFLHSRKEKDITQRYIKEFRIKVTGQDQTMKSLSGGNQQKVIISRILSTDPKVVILDEPTRGIDAGARGDVYRIIHELKNKGLAVLLISSDLEEVVLLSDRVVTMYHGRINHRFAGSDINLDHLMAASFGVYEDRGK